MARPGSSVPSTFALNITVRVLISPQTNATEPLQMSEITSGLEHVYLFLAFNFFSLLNSAAHSASLLHPRYQEQ
jgi:hypothetical protein